MFQRICVVRIDALLGGLGEFGVVGLGEPLLVFGKLHEALVQHRLHIRSHLGSHLRLSSSDALINLFLDLALYHFAALQGPLHRPAARRALHAPQRGAVFFLLRRGCFPSGLHLERVLSFLSSLFQTAFFVASGESNPFDPLGRLYSPVVDSAGSLVCVGALLRLSGMRHHRLCELVHLLADDFCLRRSLAFDGGAGVGHLFCCF